MPFTDSERYQSRLFNFFHQQKRRWSEKIQRTARHVKVNANWSLEALMHSAVLMMRKVIESRGKRLKPGKNPDNSSVAPEYTEIQKQELIDTQGNLNPSLPSSGENGEIGIETQIVPSPKGAIAFFDTAIAKFESNALVPVSQASGGLLAFIQTQFKIFVYGEQAVNTAEKDKKNELQKLIATALKFLFDRNQNSTNQLRINTSEEIPSTPLPPPKSSPSNLESQEIADPWLTLSDLFGNSQETTAEEEKAETNSDVPRKSKNPPQNWLKRYQQFLQQPQPDIELVNQQPPSVNITATTTAENDTSSLSELNTTNNQLETNPDFIETQAKIVGYAQHPLERVLQWLDNGMLWLEEKIITVFNFIQGLWRRK